MKRVLTLRGVNISANRTHIVRNFSLTLNAGELHVLMGPNGSGKSTVAHAIAGNPRYRVTARAMKLSGTDIRSLSPDKRARLGVFLAFQYPLAIPGLSLNNMLPQALAARARQSSKNNSGKSARAKSANMHTTLASKMAHEARRAATALRTETEQHIRMLSLPPDILDRDLNQDFSGGEKKKAELLQMMALKPKLAILDEPDSGLDIDALKKIADAIEQARKQGTATLLITHYQRILKYVKPDRVHVLAKGKLVRSGEPDLAREIENKGYGTINAHVIAKNAVRKQTH